MATPLHIAALKLALLAWTPAIMIIFWNLFVQNPDMLERI